MDAHPALLNPTAADATAPEDFTVEFDTTVGPMLIDVNRAWSPHGADRFYNLVNIGFFTDIIFYRVIEGFMAQCGLHGDPTITKAWRDAFIPDDPVVEQNIAGRLSFATSGPGRRTTQIFINTADNRRLDTMGFSPFGVVRDIEVAKALHAGYGESTPSGKGPRQGNIHREGNAMLRRDFPELDSIKTARIV
ncbi:Peptidyl-prolyl cis-trans isomerase [Chondrus crispus]|uniref:Peptidyl-prolyl cis-trans isomerase n=1 Tax=Chondrus crispus TaxID=2769 RepID=R7QVS9_CHOCR|nr:Peptidyl-prolyl cis-trans isomerase [Chondrus crispus]CDF41415.1 Peptidyl-prolyl cis-trans isomerase [Chondrus crispus]|eukprot:XP_005711709.1 Peptidyl-prolyl cis-trans isomerase [Chondrus crispus]